MTQREFPCGVCGCSVKMPKNAQMYKESLGDAYILGRRTIQCHRWNWAPKSSDGPQMPVQCKECRDLLSGKIRWVDIKS